ncbi:MULTISPECIES: glycosyltransferase family 39 protein [Cyanophyceae]|uniref:glycosyltransferase family 39 protein n=1 Tax=Cyanophyceae TaxID=3028117 RepID=UPI00168585DF|nr:glycosyltransferase family 39 protein [Trichocoleus sp. FACHB-69]MBD1933928.1 glycosyltransferase family 39 protein [Trichocoleus sp. FACHB-69]
MVYQPGINETSVKQVAGKSHEKDRLRHWALPPKGLRFLIIILLILGVFFRFSNLDKKVYWRDEAMTSLQISGYTKEEVVREAFTGNVIGIEDLQKYVQINPEKGLGDSIQSLIKEDPQHPPLYVILGRFWVHLFGNSVAATRSLSAVMSLLVLPCIYWLCLELFDSSLVGWIAVALIAVSPFHVLYAQEAREYSMWTMTILLSSAALLRAMRLKTKSSWGIYAATLILGFYTYLLSILIAIGHGIYVIAVERFRLNKTAIAYLVSSLVASISFIPWLVQIHEVDAASWTAKEMPFLSLVRAWVGGFKSVFLDLHFNIAEFESYLGRPLSIALLSLAIYSLYFVCRQTQIRVWLFIFTLIGVTGLTLILPDLIFGGQRSAIARYLTPCYLGIQLAVAYLLATKIFSGSQQQLWKGITTGLFLAGVVSCASMPITETSWHKATNSPQLAPIINKANKPLLISTNRSYNISEILSYSYLLEPKVKLQLVTEPNLPKMADGFSDVFLLDPSKEWRSKLEKEQNYKINLLEEGQYSLWKLEK